MKYNLQNRRYIGNKFKLLNFIDSVLKSENVKFDIVADVFAGTGVVSEYFMRNNKKVIINDKLYSNYVCYLAWMSNKPFSDEKVTGLINFYNHSEEFIKDNYFSDTFSGTYFHYKDAKKIGSIREHLETIKQELAEREYMMLLSSLLYTTDKIANGVGHFEAFLSNAPTQKGVTLRALNITKYKENPLIYQEDANCLIKKIQTDLLYLDPPYNARQYINFYHILENLAEWKKPTVSGKTLKMPRQEKMSEYSKAKAKDFLKDLVISAKTKFILLSYNNTYKANSGASINKISEQDICTILNSVGKIKRFDTSYRYFNSGKTNFDNHREILYLCKKNENN